MFTKKPRFVVQFYGRTSSLLLASAGCCDPGVWECQSNLYVWKTRDGSELLFVKYPGNARSVFFSSDSKKVVLITDDGVIKIWDIPKGEIIFQTGNKNNRVYTAVFDADSAFLLTGKGSNLSYSRTGTPGYVQTWSLTTGELVSEVRSSDAVWFVAFSPDNQYVVFADIISINICENNINGQCSRISVDGVWGLRAVNISPDSKWLILVEGVGPDYFTNASPTITLTVRELATGEEISRVVRESRNGRRFIGIAISPKGHRMALLEEDGVSVWALTPEELIEFSCERLHSCFDFLGPGNQQ